MHRPRGHNQSRKLLAETVPIACEGAFESELNADAEWSRGFRNADLVVGQEMQACRRRDGQLAKPIPEARMKIVPVDCSP